MAGPSGIYMASGDRAEVRRYDSSGSLQMILRFQVAPVPVTEAQIDSVLDAELALSNLPEGVRRLFSLMPIPGSRPSAG